MIVLWKYPGKGEYECWVREGHVQKEDNWRNNKKQKDQKDGTLVGSDTLAKGLRSHRRQLFLV